MIAIWRCWIGAKKMSGNGQGNRSLPPRTGRLRRAKWLGLGLCALVCAVWLCSYIFPYDDDRLMMVDGLLGYGEFDIISIFGTFGCVAFLAVGWPTLIAWQLDTRDRARRRRRVARLKKCGSAACGLVAAAWALSVPLEIAFTKGPASFSSFWLRDGSLHWEWTEPARVIYVRRNRARVSILPRHLIPMVGEDILCDYWGETPLYIILLAVAWPTALLIRYCPKRPEGHCEKCGYNLFSNTSGKCPECGTLVARKGAAA